MTTPNQITFNTTGNPGIVAATINGGTFHSNANQYNVSGHQNGAATHNFESTISGGQTTQSSLQPDISVPRQAQPGPPPGGCADASSLSDVLESIPLVAHNIAEALFYGMALILNIHYYDPPDDPKANRHGSEVDVGSFIALFKKFRVLTYVPATEGKRVTKEHVEAWISEFKEKFVADTTNKKACFVVVMGHGNDNGLLKVSSGSFFSMEEVIFSQFNNAHFPHMIHQPKIFFTNCCRGSQNTPPVPIKPPGQTDAGDRTVPTIEDLLIFWSTTPGNYSVRDPVKGSDFVNILCSRFDEYVAYLRKGKPGVDIKIILESISVKMTQTRSDCEGLGVVTQVPNIDGRAFGSFQWLLDDCLYIKGHQCPF